MLNKNPFKNGNKVVNYTAFDQIFLRMKMQ